MTPPTVSTSELQGAVNSWLIEHAPGLLGRVAATGAVETFAGWVTGRTGPTPHLQLYLSTEVPPEALGEIIDYLEEHLEATYRTPGRPVSVTTDLLRP